MSWAQAEQIEAMTAEISRLKAEVEKWHGLYQQESATADQWAEVCDEVKEENARLKEAIRTVLADAESQHPGGWGPDITMVAVLRKALEG